MSLEGWKRASAPAVERSALGHCGAESSTVRCQWQSARVQSFIMTTKKETLNSVVNTSEDLVKRTMDSAKVLDPRDMLKAGNDLLQKTTTATSEWVSKAASAVQNATRAAQGDSKSDTVVTN